MIRTTFLRRCGLSLLSVFRQQSQAAAAVLRPADLRAAVFQPSFDLNKMTELLDHDNHEMRSRFRQFVSEPVMIPRYNIPLLEERDVALQRLQVLNVSLSLPPASEVWGRYCFHRCLFTPGCGGYRLGVGGGGATYLPANWGGGTYLG